MSIIVTFLIAIVVIVLVKFLLDWIGVPQPLNWIILLVITLAALLFMFGKHFPGS
jgi:hypothetical protein